MSQERPLQTPIRSLHQSGTLYSDTNLLISTPPTIGEMRQ